MRGWPKALILGLVLLCGEPTWAASPALEAGCPPGPQGEAWTLARPQPGTGAAQDKGFLWELKKDGASSYLYGTLHFAKREWTAPGPVLEQALGRASRFAVELDITRPDSAWRVHQAVREAVEASPAAGAETAAFARSLDRYLLDGCIDPAQLASASLPLKFSMMVAISGRREGLFPEFAIDARIAQRARAARKELIELETPAEQAAALVRFVQDSAADDAGAQALIGSGDFQKTLGTMGHAWARSDLAPFEATARANTQRYRPLLSDRNQVLAARIQRFYERVPQGFAAIGTLHMVGPDSVLAHLARAGYEVTRLWPPEAGDTGATAAP